MINALFFFILSLIIQILFFMIGKKIKSEYLMSSAFECGFSSYFFSRFSFSMHYFMVGLIFLFLDLELCYLLPFFNQDFSSNYMPYLMVMFMIILILGLLEEWRNKMLDWKF